MSHGGIIHALEQAHEANDGWQRLDNLTGRWFEVTADSLDARGHQSRLTSAAR